MMQDLTWAQGFAKACTAKLPGHLDHENLQSAGVLGYLRAASRYDASKGTTFRGFCAVRIRGAVLDELRRWNWAPRSVRKNHLRITRVTHSLMEKLEREPTENELAQALGMEAPELALYQTQAQPRQLLSLDEIIAKSRGDENLSLNDRLPDPAVVPPDAALLLTENRWLVRECLKSLPKTQVTVIVLHYLQGVSLREVANTLAVTPSRVSQLHHQALGRLLLAWQRNQKFAGP